MISLAAAFLGIVNASSLISTSTSSSFSSATKVNQQPECVHEAPTPALTTQDSSASTHVSSSSRKLRASSLSKLSPRSRVSPRSEEHTSELQSRGHLVCRLLLEKKK